jgi:hypothetical protein
MPSSRLVWAAVCRAKHPTNQLEQGHVRTLWVKEEPVRGVPPDSGLRFESPAARRPNAECVTWARDFRLAAEITNYLAACPVADRNRSFPDERPLGPRQRVQSENLLTRKNDCNDVPPKKRRRSRHVGMIRNWSTERSAGKSRLALVEAGSAAAPASLRACFSERGQEPRCRSAKGGKLCDLLGKRFCGRVFPGFLDDTCTDRTTPEPTGDYSSGCLLSWRTFASGERHRLRRCSRNFEEIPRS